MNLARAALPASLVLATGNAGKVREMRSILAAWQVEVRALGEFTSEVAAETAVTFVENAILKARFAAAKAGLPAIADDSGLEVDALGGAPGVRSARYAGTDADDTANNLRLLDALADVPAAERTARYRCVMVYLREAHDPSPLIVGGHWEGLIAREPRGERGFGYDPLFIVDATGRRAAELEPELKNRLSHRGIALRGLIAALTERTA
jgi:XTP/dITP diphosphohydrolase